MMHAGTEDLDKFTKMKEQNENPLVSMFIRFYNDPAILEANVTFF